MRIHVDIRSQDGVHLGITVGDGKPYSREVTWLDGRCLLVAADAAATVEDASVLARAVEHCDANGDVAGQLEQLKKYGQLLFAAAFGGSDVDGDGDWQKILRAAADAGASYLEVAIQGSADDDHAALQSLRWEALHDGRRFIAVEGTTEATIPVGVIRLIKPATATAAAFRRIERIPRVLFAVGSHLVDPDIRPGIEFMGIMRRLDRNGVQARVLDRAAREDLRTDLVTELKTFEPDVLHLIGHGQRVRGEVKVKLRPESADEEDRWVSASELLAIFARAGHRPTMVLLSACHTADAGGARGPGDPPVSALPFAARLVAGDGVAAGVPVVVAMAGEISDKACRVFTQALAVAIGEGKPLGEAALRGRRATFFGGWGMGTTHPVPESGHWVMPALFLAEDVPPNACLVNTARTESAGKRVHKLRMKLEPVFFGRTAFIDRLDRLLDADDELNVLIARVPGPGVGGKRLLKELGARAVRSDVLPVLLGPFLGEASSPRDLVGLATTLKECLAVMRSDVLGLGNEPRPARALAAASNGRSHREVAEAIREDLEALVDDLPDDDPVRQRPEGQPRTILLCHRVDEWGAFNDLVSLLGPNGLIGGETPVPLVFTAVDDTKLQDVLKHRWSGETWFEDLTLGRLSKERDAAGELVNEAVRGEDIVAYLWWLLNPQRRGEQVYVLSRNAGTAWPNILRRLLELQKAPIYPKDVLRQAAELLLPDYFTSGDDDDVLARWV